MNELVSRLSEECPQTSDVPLCDCERGHNGLGMAGRPCDCIGPVSEIDLRSAQLLALSFRMKSRADACVERAGSVQEAITGSGVGIGYLLCRELADATETASSVLERCSRLHRAASLVVEMLPHGPDRYELEVALEAVNV